MKKVIYILLCCVLSSVAYSQYAYYPFNGNAYDESGNNNHGIVHGALLTSDRFGNENSAYQFDGIDDFIELTNSFGGEREISVSAWFMVAGTTGDFQAIFESEVGSGSPVVHLQVNTYGNNVVYASLNGNLRVLLLPILQPTPFNQWRHVVLTSKSGETRIYQNGVLLYQRNDAFDVITTNNMRIGKGVNGRYFKGKLDDIRVYYKALSTQEVNELYNEEYINKPPVAICKNISVNLNDNGIATIEPINVDNGSFDEDGEIVSLELNKSTFDCSNIGNNTVQLTVTDNNDNVSTCDAIVSVVDGMAPTAVCKNLTINLDENGQASIVAQDVDNGSFDACGISSLILNKTYFDCSNLGNNTVTLSVIDNNDNVETCNAIVTVIDEIYPQITVDLSLTELWPPNHKMETITANVTINDNCLGNNTPILESITSNEPDNGLGDGDKPNDIQNAEFGTSDFTYDLRKERSGKGNGRIYTIIYSVEDESGNLSQNTIYITVPHDLAKSPEFFEKNDEDMLLLKSDDIFVSVFPNPIVDDCQIEILSAVNAKSLINIYNELGVIVFTTIAELSIGQNKIIIPSNSITSGVFFIEVKVNEQYQRKNFIKL